MYNMVNNHLNYYTNTNLRFRYAYYFVYDRCDLLSFLIDINRIAYY